MQIKPSPSLLRSLSGAVHVERKFAVGANRMSMVEPTHYPPAPPRPMRPEPPELLWCFDRGFEALVYLEAPTQTLLVWPRKVWEAEIDRPDGTRAPMFTLAALRLFPPCPKPVHDAIARSFR